MGHQEAFGFRCRIFDNDHHKKEEEEVKNGVFILIMVIVNWDINGRLSTRSGKKINVRRG